MEVDDILLIGFTAMVFVVLIIAAWPLRKL